MGPNFPLLRYSLAATPDVRDAHDLAVELVCHGLESRKQRAVQTVGKADDADADAVIGANRAGLGAGGLEGLGREQPEGAERSGAENFTTIHVRMAFWEF